jgi:hypothetical protein
MNGSLEERAHIKQLFDDLLEQRKYPFPQPRKTLDVPYDQGVYIIRDERDRIAHVGRTHRGKYGLNGRLGGHLAGQSSFVGECLKDDRARLRNGYTYQYLKVRNDRTRALLEYLATGLLCPIHCGTGAELREA